MFKIKSKILKKLGQANTSLRLFHLRACPKSLPAANSQLLRKLTTGFMAGLCAFSMLGSSMSGAITASAASTPMENPAFPSADTVIAKAATLLGTPYTYGNKGYWYAYDQGQYTPLSVETINNLGIDCSGLVYYTLTQLLQKALDNQNNVMKKYLFLDELPDYVTLKLDRKSTRLNSSHWNKSRMPSSA